MPLTKKRAKRGEMKNLILKRGFHVPSQTKKVSAKKHFTQEEYDDIYNC